MYAELLIELSHIFKESTMLNRPNLKLEAKKQLRTIFWPALLVCMIVVFLGYGFINFINNVLLTSFDLLSGPFTIDTVIFIMLLLAIYQFFINGPFMVGRARFFLRGAENARVADLFFAFRTKSYWNIVFGQAAVTSIVAVAFLLPILLRIRFFTGNSSLVGFVMFHLLFFIPGFILHYKFRLIPFIFAQDPDMWPLYALSLCNKQSAGRRWEMFLLDMSFLGWYVLAPLAFGIGVFFVIPYHEATRAQFYHALVSSFGKVSDEKDTDTHSYTKEAEKCENTYFR